MSKTVKPLPKWAHVEVAWEDIHVENSAVKSDDYVRDYKACLRKTMGYVIGSNERYLWIAETDDREANVGDADCERVNTILRVNIISIHLLARPMPKAKSA